MQFSSNETIVLYLCGKYYSDRKEGSVSFVGSVDLVNGDSLEGKND